MKVSVRERNTTDPVARRFRPMLLAGILLVDWLWGEDSISEGISLSDLFLPLLSPLTSAWMYLVSWMSYVWDWFDGTWLWAPWLAVAGWWNDVSIVEDVAQELSEEGAEGSWMEVLYWPVARVLSLGTSVGELGMSAAGTLGEGTVTVLTSVGTGLSAVFAWLLACLTCIPSLISSAATMAASPFKSMSWESAPSQNIPFMPQTPVPAAYHSSVPDSQSSLDLLLRDKQLLSMLVRNLLESEEFDRVMAERQSSSQQQVHSTVDSAFTAALTKIDQELNKVRGELNDKIVSEETSVESKMEALKQQVLDLQMALQEHKALVTEQSNLESLLEAKISTSGQLHNDEQVKLRQQILLKIEQVKEEIRAEFLSIQSSQTVVVASKDNDPTPNPSEVEALINSTVERLLAIYDADKIAKVDYALANAGGCVLNTRCTETYSKKNAQYYMWGYPLWSKAANDPRIALEPSIIPGECWAFTGSRGYLVIELSENISVTAFTLEHPHRSLSPTGTIDTAPKDFKVLGLESEQDDTPILLGRFRYEDNGVSLQHFQALVVDHAFKIVELVIESNHGNLEYTCLYRFRVHGRPNCNRILRKLQRRLNVYFEVR